MKSNRLERVNSEIQKEVALIINNELRDPQITSMIGVSEVDVAPDLANAKVYLSVYGGDAQDTLNRVKGAGSFIRGRLAKKIRLRIIPRLDFYLDNSQVYGQKIDELLSNITYTTNPDDQFDYEED
ncbi:MAG: 30S ribosome-binding factor RbfA [Clostridia bacterium]|nr:30S ribosome-binding factor RbfA [Clostridia bacterium]